MEHRKLLVHETLNLKKWMMQFDATSDDQEWIFVADEWELKATEAGERDVCKAPENLIRFQKEKIVELSNERWICDLRVVRIECCSLARLLYNRIVALEFQ